MDHQRSYRILRIGQFGCFVPLLLSYVLSQFADLTVPSVLLFILGAGMVFGGVIQAWFFYRCPHCDMPFDIRVARPDYCSRCGNQIDW